MKYRKVEVLECNEWKDVNFKDLKINNIFRMYDDGILYKDKSGKSEWKIISEPYLNKDNIWSVDVEE